MESKKIATKMIILTLVFILAAICGKAKLVNDDGSICGMSQDELLKCKPAVATGTATPPPPTAACCGALHHANVTCLCGFKNNKYLSLFGINSTLAMQLPSKCDFNDNFHC
ncbi:lipid-transfer protein [Striga asiatica]|uniref:Lipid-transfer protein n=1 Tax=Striga asiatica TaxID=4170 RepID=A0A5A7R0V0_STRAF|nr:lipid-transfer protein [Striga asiatica]